MAEIAQKESKNINSGQITDLNLVIANMKMSGMTGREIAKELNISDAAVSQHLKRFRNLIEVDGASAINDSRARLTQRLVNGERVLDYALRPKTFKKSATYLGIAKDFTLSMFKGLGVLVDRTENVTKIDVYAQQREDQQARIEAAKQFGLNPDKELPTVEVQKLDNGVQTGSKQAQDVEQPDSPVNVERETSSQPDNPDPT